MPHVITITGSSRAGKSTTVDYLLNCGRFSQTFSPVLMRKYTTRPRRIDDNHEEVLCVNEIPAECDLVYKQYGAQYGLALSALFEHIAQEQSPIVILNDVRAVEDVRSAFGELARSLFIFRHDPSSEKYREELMESRKGAGRVRFDKARIIYRIYIENIQLFDHVIINSGPVEELEMQVGQIVKSLE